MDKKEQKSKEYAKEQYPYTEEMRFQCEQHFESGWDEALKDPWIRVEDGLPKENETVLVLFIYDGMVSIDTDTYFGETFYEMYGIKNEWNFGGCKILAWMPIPPFDEILRDNKDVLKRLKDK